MAGRALRAYGGQLRPKWPFLAFSLAFTVLAVVNSTRAASEQFALPYWAWGLIALGCLSVAQFLAWRDLWVDDVEPNHANELRAIARRLREQLNGTEVPTYTDEAALAAWAVEHMFQAHCSEIAEKVESCREELITAEQARAALIENVFKQGAFDRFGAMAGWSWGGIAQRCETHLREVIDGGGGTLDIRADTGSGCVVWTTTVVFDARDVADRDGATAAAVALLLEWIAGIRHSREAVAYREALQAATAYRLAALHLLDPVAHGQRIRKTHRCRICFP
jgi:hypothetical protein